MTLCSYVPFRNTLAGIFTSSAAKLETSCCSVALAWGRVGALPVGCAQGWIRMRMYVCVWAIHTTEGGAEAASF